MAKKKKKYKGYCGKYADGGVLVDDGIVKYNTIYNYILQLDKNELDKELNRRIESYMYYPPLRKIFKPFVLKKFFPQFIGPLSNDYVGQQMHDLEYITIPRLCERMIEEAKGGYDKANEMASWYLSGIMVQIAQFKVTFVDGKIYHIADYRINGDRDTKAIIKNVTTDQKQMISNSNVVAGGFLELFRRWEEINREDFHRLADWYLKDLYLDQSIAGAEAILKTLNDILALDIKEVSDFILELYEEHSESFNKMMRKFPRYDFVIRGKSDRYNSISDYARAHPEESEFFVEEANADRPVSPSKLRRQRNKEARAEFRVKVLEALDLLFKEVQRDDKNSEIHILNFTPNELKTKKPQSNYIAVAFKRDGLWWILVDCIKPGSAIYLWRGERYTHGLDVFKMARTFARQEAGVFHKNHVQTREFIEIYHLLMKMY